MTPVGRWFRDVIEKVLGRFYDGPTPPERLAKIVLVWADMNPTATRAEWVRFAIEHSRECYRAGWTRGYEYTERDPDERTLLEQLDPDTVADAMNPDWRWEPNYEMQEAPDTVVRETQLTEREEVERLFQQMKKERGR